MSKTEPEIVYGDENLRRALDDSPDIVVIVRKERTFAVVLLDEDTGRGMNFSVRTESADNTKIHAKLVAAFATVSGKLLKGE